MGFEALPDLLPITIELMVGIPEQGSECNEQGLGYFLSFLQIQRGYQ